MRRARRAVVDTDNIILILVVVGIVLVATLGLPVALPDLQQGARCTNLPSPKGGNHQSLLALASDNQDMTLELTVVTEQVEGNIPIVEAGDPLNVRVTFNNNDVGPITLYLSEDDRVVGDFEALAGQGIVGLVFEITPVDSEVTYTDTGVTGQIQPQVFELDNLHILRAQGRCFVEADFTRERFIRMNIQPGEYEIKAYYRNAYEGDYIPPTPAGNNPTPTPMFENMNVWVGRVESNSVRFIVE
ncbi:MAG: hypothetical protein GYB66_00910 [Chloroflexi bacterium]|nr:hypothetical protein [Chloroflexota bacterium]